MHGGAGISHIQWVAKRTRLIALFGRCIPFRLDFHQPFSVIGLRFALRDNLVLCLGWNRGRAFGTPITNLITGGQAMSHNENQNCIQSCVRCAQECEHCGNACLGEDDSSKMAECIRLDRDCAELCWLAAGMLSRGSGFMHEICDLCAEVCEACGAECRRHQFDHCQRCADECEKCAEECRRMASIAA